MGKIVIVIIGVLASLMLADSLTCNQCKYSLLSFCIGNSALTCPTNTSVCFSGNTTFPDLSGVGFKNQGCKEIDGCNATTNGTLLGISYQTKISCCSSDKCNNAAPSTKMTFTAVIGVAAMALMWGSVL
ncbi:uncharacterized protein spaca4l isoform X1 [Pungitius pungitius]|uniref:uncharacterized protein spaca4l isoform X1 n=1 Tax=Pungitius pungitius TaxID=134920 RepID=UPI002E13685A